MKNRRQSTPSIHKDIPPVGGVTVGTNYPTSLRLGTASR